MIQYVSAGPGETEALTSGQQSSQLVPRCSQVLEGQPLCIAELLGSTVRSGKAGSKQDPWGSQSLCGCGAPWLFVPPYFSSLKSPFWNCNLQTVKFTLFCCTIL